MTGRSAAIGNDCEQISRRDPASVGLLEGGSELCRPSMYSKGPAELRTANPGWCSGERALASPILRASSVMELRRCSELESNMRAEIGLSLSMPMYSNPYFLVLLLLKRIVSEVASTTQITLQALHRVVPSSEQDWTSSRLTAW